MEKLNLQQNDITYKGMEINQWLDFLWQPYPEYTFAFKPKNVPQKYTNATHCNDVNEVPGKKDLETGEKYQFEKENKIKKINWKDLLVICSVYKVSTDYFNFDTQEIILT